MASSRVGGAHCSTAKLNVHLAEPRTNAARSPLDHLTLPLEHLRREVDFFARTESLRLLHVVVDFALHTPTLEVLRAMQWSPDNKRAVVVFEDPDDPKADRWTVWSEQLLAEFASIRAAYEKTGVTLNEIAPMKDDEPILRFAKVTKTTSDILSQPPATTNGLVVMFATTDLQDPNKWLAFLDEILHRTPSLSKVRWGWMETGQAIGNDFVGKLGGETALHVTCRVDPVRQKEDLEDLLSAMAEAHDDAKGPAAAGAAAPAVSPPAHPTDPPKDAAEALPARQANRLFLQGLQAVRAGDMKEAVKLQDLAFQACLSAQNVSMAVEMELLLATYVVQAAGGEKASLRSALALFQRASERAHAANLIVAGAKIDILLAPMAKLVGDLELAGKALRRAADATRALAPALSIEALRLAADFMLEHHNSAKASELCTEALEIATTMPPAEAKQTSAAICAEALATIFRSQKLESRAVEMDTLARRLAAGMP